ncbi:PstS family phosphate ABC transporter substrate-binding protein [Piscinibacter sp.]|jgi:phosphate transport system substrate-binding protein|uniref:PstS family phosphate ABC transporter substrate-binding protein n=1 Tax=Piscinibacter sp. TaxID=1903157 RepID=UPI002F3FBED4
MRNLVGALLALASAAPAGAAPTVDPALPAYTPQAVQVPKDARYRAPDGSIRIVGAEHAEAMIERFDALFTQTHPGIRFTPVLRGTSTAMPALTHGVTLFGPSGRDASAVEVVPYKKIVGTEPLAIRVAHSSHVSSKASQSLAVFVHKSNPIDKLTIEQLQRVFTAGHSKGELNDWGQLGLDKEWSRRAIHTYGTPEYTGFGQYMQRTHFNGMPLKATQHVYPNSPQITKGIAGDASGIGIASLAFASAELKVVPVVDARGKVATGTPEEAMAGEYPLGRYLYFFVRKLPGQPVDPVAKEYLKLVLSQQGQQIIAADAESYLPLNAAEAAAELEKLQ